MAALDVINGIGTVAGALGSLGSALGIGGKGKTKYITDSNNVVNDPNRVSSDGSTFGDLAAYKSNRVPESVYYSFLMNKNNQDWQEKMWNKTNEYNSAKNQALRLLQAGINPTLAMANDGSVGQAQSVSGVNGSVDMTSRSLEQSGANVAMEQFGAGLRMIPQAIQQIASSRKLRADAKLSELDAETRSIENWQRIRKIITASNLDDKEAALKELDTQFMRDTYEDRAHRINADATHAFNETQMDIDRSDMLKYQKTKEYYMSLLAKKDYQNYDRNLNSIIAERYSQALLNGASAKAAAQQAVESAARTAGLRIDNQTKAALQSDLIEGTRQQYKAMQTQRELLEQRLAKAKKDNDTYMIRLIGDELEQLSMTFRNVSVGVAGLRGFPVSDSETVTESIDAEGRDSYSRTVKRNVKHQ